TKAAACTTWVTWCFLIACRMRGMSSTSPCSKSTLSRMSGMRLSSRCRAKITGRWPSWTNLRLVSAPMTPMPPVIKTFIRTSFDLGADGVDQRGPVLQVALDELAEVLWREINPLQCVGCEELLGLWKVQRLRDVGMDLGQEIGRHLRGSPEA